MSPGDGEHGSTMNDSVAESVLHRFVTENKEQLPRPEICQCSQTCGSCLSGVTDTGHNSWQLGWRIRAFGEKSNNSHWIVVTIWLKSVIIDNSMELLEWSPQSKIW